MKNKKQIAKEIYFYLQQKKNEIEIEVERLQGSKTEVSINLHNIDLCIVKKFSNHRRLIKSLSKNVNEFTSWTTNDLDITLFSKHYFKKDFKK